jgi:hypothetical protein
LATVVTAPDAVFVAPDTVFATPDTALPSVVPGFCTAPEAGGIVPLTRAAAVPAAPLTAEPTAEPAFETV